MSDFWLRKIATFFTRIDLDHDGFLTIKDFEMMAEKLIESGQLDVKRGTQLKDTLTEVCDKCLTVGDQPMTKDMYLEEMKKSFLNPDLTQLTSVIHSLFFASIDTNSDGVIQQKEFELFFKILGIDSNMAKVAFQAIDTNDDGLLSIEEYLAAGQEFVTGTDESSPTKYFWGPLV